MSRRLAANAIVLPVPRRGLTHDEAAAYCGLSSGSFDEQVKAGIYPASLATVGRPRTWDRLALDRAMDALSGIADATAGRDRRDAALKKILRNAS